MLRAALPTAYARRLTFAVVAIATMLSLSAAAQTGGAYQVTNLVSDGSVAAPVTDPNFINPWAISASGTWWIATQGTGYDYAISSTTGAISFKVIVPTAAAPNAANGVPAGSVTTGGTTGMVLPNGTKASFLFSTLDGTISGWNSKLGTANAISEVVINNSSTDASYPGLAIINTATASYILAPNFASGKMEIYNSTFQPTTLTGTFTDPSLPAGYSPFSVHVINNQVWVAYALRSSTAPYSAVSAVGNGAVSLFDTSGNFISRVVTGGDLDSPWGVAIAPASFGIYSNDVLVGNFGNGRINVYSPVAPYGYLGQLTDGTGTPLSYPSLWELLPAATAVGNTTSASGGSAGTVYFTAGLAGEAHGLLAGIANNTTATGTPTFGLSASTGSLTVAAGSSAQATIGLAPTYNFSGMVNFACSGLPVSATCAFSPSQVSAVGTAPSTTTVTIQTSSYAGLVRPFPHRATGLACAVFLPFGTILAFYRRRSARSPLRLLALCAVSVAMLGAIAGCGGYTASPPSTPSGSSQVVITATSGSITQSTTIALTVQ